LEWAVSQLQARAEVALSFFFCHNSGCAGLHGPDDKIPNAPGIDAPVTPTELKCWAQKPQEIIKWLIPLTDQKQRIDGEPLVDLMWGLDGENGWIKISFRDV